MTALWMAARWLVFLAGAGLAAAGIATILGQATAGTQPWSGELSDNLIFGRAIPLVLAFGVATGLLTGWSQSGRTARRARDGALRRFSRTTIVGHWLITIGFVLALPTGVWQYIGGIIDVHAPMPLYVIYRLHYIGATIVLFTVAMFVTYWWVTGERTLVVPLREWRRYANGLVVELPRYLAGLLTRILRLDPALRPPETGKFTFYERLVSFPSWAFVLALITVTGLFKAIRYGYELPGPFVFFNSTLHVTAMVLIVIKVLDHLRYTLARWPLVGAMVTGWLGEGYARLRHPGWHRQVAGAPSAGARSAAGSAAQPTGVVGRGSDS